MINIKKSKYVENNGNVSKRSRKKKRKGEEK